MDRFLPPHWNFSNQFRLFLAPLAIHTLWSMGFYTQLTQWIDRYPSNFGLGFPTFWELAGSHMVCLYLVAAYLLVWGIMATGTFFAGGKNIYRIRRMPWGHGPLVRSALLPLFGALVTLAWSALLLAFQFWAYWATVPVIL